MVFCFLDNKMNGNGERTPNSAKPVVTKNYKLMVDPMLTGKKEAKVYRYEGIVANDPVAVTIRDPRSRILSLSKRLEALDLPVPR